MKKLVSTLLILCLLLTSIPFIVAAEGEEVTPNPEAYPSFADLSYGALYAHATLGGDSTQAWQRWHKDITGMNAEDGVRYFFLPQSADDNKVEIYNNYGDGAATIGDITIESYTSAIIDYVEGEKIKVTLCKGTASERDYTFVVYKSDAEASVYVNDTANSYTDYNDIVQETDLWSFLIQNKENSVSDSDCAIADESGVLDTTLKKIKGRGNTNWRETDKKPFNLTFYDKTSIGGVSDKKFSFVSNAKDSTLLRNSIMYDLAYNVDSQYAPDQSFIDFFVNGVYRGSYIATQKIDLGKNSVVSLKDESDDKDTDFNFLVEVDVWNYSADVYFETENGYHVVLKTPDLEDYDETDPNMKAKYEYIRDTYQKFEDALYSGTLEDIEKLCDLDSLATQYLLQEFGKNCDGGYTSTYFTYNAEEGKFYAAPIWDCDSCLGAVSVMRDGCSTSTIDHKGWTTRLAEYEGTINPLGQAFYVDGTSSEGQTFEEICIDIWNEKFIPQIDVLLGNSDAQGRLKSIDDYANSIAQSAYNNYVMWNFMWLSADKNSSLRNDYSADYAGEVDYLKDWVAARADWMSTSFGTEIPDNGGNNGSNSYIYFSTDLGWDNVHYYTWSTGYVPMRWPGEPAELVESTDDEVKIYRAPVDTNVDSIIFNNGDAGEQTVDILLTNDVNLYTTTDSTGRVNEDGALIYNVESGVYLEPVIPTEPTTSVVISTETTESQVATEATDASSSDDPTESSDTSASDSTNSAESTSVPAVTDPTEPIEPTATTVTTEPTEAPATSNQTAPVIDGTDATDASEPNTTVTTATNADATQQPTTESKPADDNDGAVLGDVNEDGKVSIKDTTLIQKYIAKLSELSNIAKNVADVNKDGKISISDATTIQKFIAGLIELL